LKNEELYRKLTDEELVDQIVKTKNAAPFEVLYDRYSSIVYNKCHSFAKNDAEAQDLAQDVFIRLYVKLGSFKKKSKFSTWLYALTYNYCVNYVSRNKSKKIKRNSVLFEEIDQNVVDVDKTSLFEIKVDNLQKAMEIVPPEDKMILLLKYQDDMRIKEISEILSIGKSAAKMRLKRARARVVGVYNKLLKYE
jgi:RNA polymerase sigma-70 factor (ECF subfamily)